MPKPDESTNGAPCWVDLFSSDTDKATAFYGELFGWAAESAGPEYGGYINFSKDGARIAGCMNNDGSSGAPDMWSVYLSTPNAQATADAAVAAGGEVIVPVMEVMQLGTMAMVTDAGHAAIGLWQPGLHRGFDLVAEPGAPAWFELQTRDYDDSVAFYRQVFGWDTHAMSDSSELRYTTLGEGERAQAGIMDASAFLPEGVPAHWTIYFAVADTDAALKQVGELGGAVVQPAENTPYGRLGGAADPTGATSKVMGPTT